jgi:signal transduction histidine kinase/CheY-like chemotaxis protein
MEPSPTDLLPLIAPELLAATATAAGKRLGSNAAWDTIFGRGELWENLSAEDRRFAGEYLAEAGSGALVTHQVFLVARHHEELPAPVLLNFLPVHLPDADVGARPVVITGEVLQEPKRWALDQTKRRRMEMLGQMSMGIAHDFNNLLTSILGHVELLTDPSDLSIPPDARDQLYTIRRAAMDGAALVRKIQRYIRHENKQRFEPIDLAELVDEVASLTRPYWYNEPRRQGIHIKLVKELEPVPLIQGVEAELREVFVNLILNAVQAMPEGGSLTLSTGVDGNGQVFTAVDDTGVGIPESARHRIFEPLFTTKGEDGTGMGLPVSYGIVREHDGTMDVQSEPGWGTRFTMHFPPLVVSDEDAAPAPTVQRDVPAPPSTVEAAPTASAPAATGSEAASGAKREAEGYTILVVDDEAMVRNVTAKLLRMRGHSVEEARGGPDALEKIADRPFDLIVTDLGMPEMSGSELAYRIRQHHPALCIVLLTGHTDAEDQSEHVDTVVKKPFRIDVLEATIQRLMAGNA